jgi:hypothetical protein
MRLAIDDCELTVLNYSTKTIFRLATDQSPRVGADW